MRKYILILIGLSVLLVGCTAVDQEGSNDTKVNTTEQITENDMEDNEVVLLSFFAPGYETFDAMVED